MALDFLAGCAGGCAGVFVGHPLDTIKVHIQTQCAISPKYTGTVDCIRKIYTREGVRGFYRGMTSPLAGVACLNAIVFGIYGNAQRRFKDPDALRTHFLAGSCAGFFQSAVASPMELAKLRVQVSNDAVGPLECMQKIYAREGVRGLFRGLNMTILRDVPSFASYFLTYEYLVRTENGEHASTTRLLMAGGFAGVISWTFSYPVDVIKSRLQFDGINGISQYTNAMDCLRKSLASEGQAFLWRGLTPTLIRAFPVNATVFTVVTWTMRLLDTDFKFDVLVIPDAVAA